jgi:polar amino acid transport system substrate-binding protein
MLQSRRQRVVGAGLAAAFILAGLAACGDSGSGGETIKKGVLSVCSDIPYEPFEFAGKGPNGLKYTGFDIELIDAVATGKYDVTVKVVPFDGILNNIATKDCDIAVSSITITDDRAKQVLFSDPYFDADQSLLVKTDSGIANLDDLAGKTFGVQTGTTGETYAKAHKPDGATIKSFDGADGLFSALEAGDIKGVLQDLPVNAFRATKDDSVKVVQTYKTNEKYGFAIRKNNTDLQKTINAGLEKVRDNGTYDKLYVKYFGTKPPS